MVCIQVLNGVLGPEDNLWWHPREYCLPALRQVLALAYNLPIRRDCLPITQSLTKPAQFCGCMFSSWRLFSECGRTITGVPRGSKMMRIYVDNAAPEKLKGLCIFFVRCRNEVAINSKTIYEVRFETPASCHVSPVPLFPFLCGRLDWVPRKWCICILKETRVLALLELSCCCTIDTAFKSLCFEKI